MLVFSKSRITVTPRSGVTVEGSWERYAARIRTFLKDLPVEQGSIRLLWGRVRFSRHFDAGLRQRIRNFLVNECP